MNMAGPRRKLTGELDSATLANLPGVRDIVRSKLSKFQAEISTKTNSNYFKTTGYKSTFLSSSVVNEKIVPKGIASGYKECVKGLEAAASAETSLNSLIEFVAIMKLREERKHGGRDTNTTHAA